MRQNWGLSERLITKGWCLCKSLVSKLQRTAWEHLSHTKSWEVNSPSRLNQRIDSFYDFSDCLSKCKLWGMFLIHNERTWHAGLYTRLSSKHKRIGLSTIQTDNYIMINNIYSFGPFQVVSKFGYWTHYTQYALQKYIALSKKTNTNLCNQSSPSLKPLLTNKMKFSICSQQLQVVFL